MAHHIDFINNVSTDRKSWNLKVRIIRLWERTNYYNPKQVTSLEMVLVDEKVFFL